MQIAETIKKAREMGMSDDRILEAIEKQNPHKKSLFKEAKEKGLNSTDILNKEILKSEENNKKYFETERSKPEEPPEVPKNIPQKPTEESKLWIRIFITLGLISITALTFTLLYRAIFVPSLEPISPQTIVKEVRVPVAKHPLIKLFPERDDVQRFAITTDEEFLIFLQRFIRERSDKEIIRIIAEDQRDQSAQSPRIIDMEDFFQIFNIDYPDNFFEKISKEFDLFVYTGEITNRLGFITSFPEENREEVEWNIMRPWEETIEKDFEEFFSFWGERVSTSENDLSSTSYQGDMSRSISIRYREGSGGMGIYYTIMNNYLLFSTSLDTIKILIDRNYELTK